MDLVYPYRTGKWGNTELRYSLRSAVKHLPEVGKIFIIGDNPGLKNVIHIPAVDRDKTFQKESNIFNKVLIACNDDRVSDDFVFMNDDHFLLQGFDIENNYAAEWGPKRTDMYGQTIENTLKVLNTVPVNFDVHCPIVFNKEKFEILSAFNWEVKAGYCMKTLYAVLTELQPTLCTDLKIDDEFLTSRQMMKMIEGRAFFSTHDRMRTDAMRNVLDSLFPLKTIYE